MVWWGWLIVVCVALVVVGWITVAAIGARAFRKAKQGFDEDVFDMRRRGPGNRWN